VISIIIPVYRDSEALARTLGALDASRAEVIVVATPMPSRWQRSISLRMSASMSSRLM
jgi:hypothetical protein